jgi:hypothetical protein
MDFKKAIHTQTCLLTAVDMIVNQQLNGVWGSLWSGPTAYAAGPNMQVTLFLLEKSPFTTRGQLLK